MQFTFTPQDAQLVAGFLASVVVPFAVSWLKQPSWPSWLRLTAAALFSLIGGLLTVYVAGTLDGGSVIVAALAVFTASQAHYKSWFEGLGIEARLNPVEATAQPVRHADE